MTFLQLCARLRIETAYADSGPSAVTGQTGAHLRCVGWIADAYTQLQNRHPWRWLRKEFTLETVADTELYAYGDVDDTSAATAITRFKSWLVNDRANPVTAYLTASGESAEYYLSYLPWEHFRQVYRLGTVASNQPVHISVTPDNKLAIGPTPNDIYTIKGEYHRSAQILAATSDTPEMPSDYHMLIVYLAMEDAGLFDVAQEIIQRGQVKGRRLLRQLEGTQLPIMRQAGPMA